MKDEGAKTIMTDLPTSDEIDRRLRALPETPLPPALAASVHERARAAFEGRGGRLVGIAKGAAVVSAVAVYLAWAVVFLSALARS